MSYFLVLLCAEAVVAFATLSFELTAARLVAPHAGLTTDTWTAIIAAFLAALALGNVAGGALAARLTAARAMRAAALANVGGAVAIWLVPHLLPHWSALLLVAPPFGMARLFAFTALPFMPAGFLLGIATPLLVTAAVAGMANAGRAVGLLYAAGAGGSFLGALVTLWLLHDLYGLRNTVMALAAALVVNAVLIVATASARRTAAP
jgi:MFS family permease